jgi:hypothetical protein
VLSNFFAFGPVSFCSVWGISIKIKSIRCVAHGRCSKRVSGKWGDGDGKMRSGRWGYI